MKNLLIVLVLVLVFGGLLYLIPNKTSQAPVITPPAATVTDFESCAAAGYPILETNPAQCKTPSGQVFVSSTVQNPDVILDTPQFGDLVASPLVVSGKVRGTWFFEANIPIILKDENGNVLVQQGYMATEDWQTTDYVNVNTTLTFPTPTTDYGVLIIHNDNPSGLPQNDKEYAVPVRFK